MKHYLVVGRMCGDDEDTGITYFVETRAEAVALYVEDMWDANTSPFTSISEDIVDRRLAEANGEGVFVNGVYESETPIKEST